MAMGRCWRRSASGGIGPHRMGATESLSHTLGSTDFHPSIYKAFWRSDMPVHRHTMHHTEANKTYKFTATCAIIYNEPDSTKVEEWLTNLETAANLTNESCAKLAKA